MSITGPMLHHTQAVTWTCVRAHAHGLLAGTSARFCSAWNALANRHHCQWPASQEGPIAVRSLTTIPEPDDAHLYTMQLETPNFIHPIQITQLDNLCRHPTVPRVMHSANFMKSQLPARLENHIARLKALPSASEPLDELLAATTHSKGQLLEVSRDWKLVDTSSMAGLDHFESHLSSFKDQVEAEMARLTASAQHLTETDGWWEQPQQVKVLNRALDLSHWYLLSARVMLTQHTAALHALHSSNQPRQHKQAGHLHLYEAHQPQQYPPHLPYLTQNLVLRHAPVRRLIENATEDCRAFCIEKNSAAPDVEIVGGENLRATVLDAYVSFVFTEIMKNAMQAQIARYGAWNVDEADAISVKISDAEDATHFTISVTDTGHGIPETLAQHMYSYFFSSSRRTSFMYGYSRDHGSQFQGIGVGVPMARVYTHFMGGHIEWETAAWTRHTTVILQLPKNGFVF
eukprot:jgi/Chrzof1/11976/Cz06g16210.t1